MGNNTVVLASDHAGFNLKKEICQLLQERGYVVIDIGTHTSDPMDYPDLARPFSKEVLSRKTPGIIICGTGIGVSIAANKMQGIRAALCHDEFTAQMSRKHNNANVLAMGSRVLDVELAKKITLVFLSTEFSGGRHERRVEKLMNLEKLLF